jgi:hypothetical protein
MAATEPLKTEPETGAARFSEPFLTDVRRFLQVLSPRSHERRVFELLSKYKDREKPVSGPGGRRATA